MVWLPGGLAAAGEGAGERVGETLHPAIRLRVEDAVCVHSPAFAQVCTFGEGYTKAAKIEWKDTTTKYTKEDTS